jgi:hypothetical protein
VYIKRERKKIIIINKAPRLSRCIGSLKRIQDQDPYSSFQPCASDNEDFVYASGSLFAICTCPLISKSVCSSLSPLLVTLFSNDLFDESRLVYEKLVLF